MIGAFFTAAVARLAPIVGAAWGKIVFAGGIALALLGVYAVIRKGGRDVERADALGKSLDTLKEMQDANAAGPHTAGDVDGRLQQHTF